MSNLEEKFKNLRYVDVVNIIAVSISLFLFAVIVVYFSTVIMDTTTTANEKSNEKIRLKLNPHMLYKDSINYKTFDYIKENNENDSYHIYFRQNIIVKMMFVVIESIFAGICIILIIILIRASYCKKEDENNFSIGQLFTIYTIVLLYIFIIFSRIAFSHYSIYTNHFEIKTLEAIKKNADNMNKLSVFIYDNITTNHEFLKCLVDDNVDNYLELIKNGLEMDNVIGVSKMIVTHTLYNSYKESKNDKSFNDIKNIFTKENIEKRISNPSYYLQYNQQPLQHTKDAILKLIKEIVTCSTSITNIDNKIKKVHTQVDSIINTINSEMIPNYTASQDAINSVYEYLAEERTNAIVYTLLLIAPLIAGFYYITYNNKKKRMSSCNDNNEQPPQPYNPPTEAVPNGKPPIAVATPVFPKAVPTPVSNKEFRERVRRGEVPIEATVEAIDGVPVVKESRRYYGDGFSLSPAFMGGGGYM